MKPEKLAAMANQIATFFRSYPDEAAASGIARHLVNFWTPAMRAALDDRAGQEDHGLDPLVVRALRQPADIAASPATRITSPALEAGQMASDAG